MFRTMAKFCLFINKLSRQETRDGIRTNLKRTFFEIAVVIFTIVAGSFKGTPPGIHSFDFCHFHLICIFVHFNLWLHLVCICISFVLLFLHLYFCSYLNCYIFFSICNCICFYICICVYSCIYVTVNLMHDDHHHHHSFQ